MFQRKNPFAKALENKSASGGFGAVGGFGGSGGFGKSENGTGKSHESCVTIIRFS